MTRARPHHHPNGLDGIAFALSLGAVVLALAALILAIR